MHFPAILSNYNGMTAYICCRVYSDCSFSDNVIFSSLRLLRPPQTATENDRTAPVSTRLWIFTSRLLLLLLRHAPL